MAEFQEQWVPNYGSSDLRCPICTNSISIEALVSIKGGSFQKTGTTGIRKPSLSVHLETKIKKIRVQHECSIEYED